MKQQNNTTQQHNEHHKNIYTQRKQEHNYNDESEITSGKRDIRESRKEGRKHKEHQKGRQKDNTDIKKERITFKTSYK